MNSWATWTTKGKYIDLGTVVLDRKYFKEEEDEIQVDPPRRLAHHGPITPSRRDGGPQE